MANQTFLNLTVTRQEEILLTAYEEFAIKGFDAASLSSIIKKLNLAKGSFYRYFNSKKELYAFLVNDAFTKRLSNLEQLVEEDQHDFFQLIEDNFMAKVQFDLENPIIGGFLYRVLIETDNKELKDIIGLLYKQVLGMVKELISHDYFKDQLGVFDEDLLSFNIFHMQMGLYTFLSLKYNIDYEENIRNNKPILSIPAEELQKVIKEQVHFLKNGIKSQQQ